MGINDHSFVLERQGAEHPHVKYIYEVNLNFHKTAFEEHGDWFLDHIKDMVESNQFEKAEICQEVNMDPIDDSLMREHRLTIRYYIKDYQQLKAYLEEQAKLMRSQVVERFKNCYSVHRRVFTVQNVLMNS